MYFHGQKTHKRDFAVLELETSAYVPILRSSQDFWYHIFKRFCIAVGTGGTGGTRPQDFEINKEVPFSVHFHF